MCLLITHIVASCINKKHENIFDFNSYTYITQYHLAYFSFVSKTTFSDDENIDYIL